MTAQVPGDFNPEEADNFEDIEKQSSVKVVEHLQTYWSILSNIRGSKLRLTKLDDEIYEHFKRDFPEFDPAATINEDDMKSKEGKEKWRKFIMAYKGKVSSYDFITMLRTNPKLEYDNDTTILVVRLQFYAIEIARNRAGLNDWIYEQAQEAKKGTEKAATC